MADAEDVTRVAEAMCLPIHRPTYWDPMACGACRNAADRLLRSRVVFVVAADGEGDRG